MRYPKEFQQQTRRTQRGAAMMAGIVIMSLLVLVAVVIGYLALTSKSEATLTVEAPKVTADDLLTEGNSNNELTIDTQIVMAGVERDEDQRKAAEAILADETLPVGDGVTTGTTVEAERLSRLQTEFIAEADRRLEALQKTTSQITKLNSDQKPAATKNVNDEIVALTGLKAKVASETSKEGFLADRDALDREYVNYGLAIAQVELLLWANGQTILGEKVNVLGGKFQERINDASNNGNTTAQAQTLLNTYQTNKTAAKDGTAAALKLILAAKPGSFEANRQVLKGYYSQLALVHNSLKNASDGAKALTLQIKTYKQ